MEGGRNGFEFSMREIADKVREIRPDLALVFHEDLDAETRKGLPKQA
jgi:hypothetical protein